MPRVVAKLWLACPNQAVNLAVAGAVRTAGIKGTTLFSSQKQGINK
jgi:hypothetical protein